MKGTSTSYESWSELLRETVTVDGNIGHEILGRDGRREAVRNDSIDHGRDAGPPPGSAVDSTP